MCRSGGRPGRSVLPSGNRRLISGRRRPLVGPEAPIDRDDGFEKEVGAIKDAEAWTYEESKKADPEKAKRKRRRLKVAHPERCIGCLSCMFACSRINTGRASLDRSAIRVKTQGGLEGDFAVVICRACKDPPCVRACPLGALEKKEDGRVVFKKELCDGCGACADACLIRAISMDAEGKAIKCKHCGACVAFCPHGVLEMEEVEE